MVWPKMLTIKIVSPIILIGFPVTPRMEIFDELSDNLAPERLKNSSETKQMLLPVSYKAEQGWPKTETSRKTGG